MTNRREQLESWLDDVQREQHEVSTALEPLLRRKEELRQKQELIQRLLNLESKSQPGSHDARKRADLPSDAPDLGVGGSRIGSDLQLAVKEILEGYGKPMHISEIRTTLVERGISIPGKGTEANIIVHLRRAPSIFERKNRGTYGLVRPRRSTVKEPLE